MSIPDFKDLGGFNKGILDFLAENNIKVTLDESQTPIEKTQNIFNAIITEIDKPQNEDVARELFVVFQTNQSELLDLDPLIFPAYKKIIDIFNAIKLEPPNDYSRFNRKILKALSDCGINISIRSSLTDVNHTRDIFEAIMVEMDKSQDPESVQSLLRFLEGIGTEVESLGAAIRPFYFRTLEAAQKQLGRKISLEQKGIDPLLWSVKDISEKQLLGLDHSVRIFRSTGMKDKEILDVVSVLKHVSDTNLDKFTELAVILKESHGAYRIGEALWELKDISGESLDNLLDLTRSLKEAGSGRTEIINILTSLKDATAEKISNLIALAGLLGEGGWSEIGDEIYSVLNALKDLPKGKIDKLFTLAGSLRDEGCSGFEIYDVLVLRGLKDASEGKIDKFSALARSLKDAGLKGNEICKFLNNAYTEEKVDKFIALARSLKDEGFEGGCFSDVLMLLKNAPKGKIDKFVALAGFLKGIGGLLEYQIYAVLVALKDTPDEKIDKLIALARFLKEEGLSEGRICVVLVVLKDAPDEKIDKLSALARFLKEEGLSEGHICVVLVVLKDAPDEKIDTLIALPGSLKDAGWDEVDIEYVAMLLKDAPDEKTDKIVAWARLLKDVGLPGHQIYYVLRDLKDTPDERIDTLVAGAGSLKEAGWNKVHIEYVVILLKDALEGEIDKLFALARFLNDAGLSGPQIFHVLKALKDAPAEKIDKLFALARSLKDAGLSGSRIQIILGELKAAPEEKVDKFFALAVLLKDEGWSVDNTFIVLRDLTNNSERSLDDIFFLIEYLKGSVIQEEEAALPEFIGAPDEVISQLLDVIRLLEGEQASKENIQRVILRKDLSSEHLKALGEAIEFFKVSSKESFQPSLLIDVFAEGIQNAENFLRYKMAEELLVVIKLAGINNISTASLQKFFKELPLPEALDFIKLCDTVFLQKVLPRPQNATIPQTVLYYLIADKVNNVPQKAICLRFLKSLIPETTKDYHEIEKTLKLLPDEVKNALVKEILFKSTDARLVEMAAALLGSEDTSLIEEQQKLLSKCQNWSAITASFSEAMQITNIPLDQQSEMKNILAELTLKQEGNYSQEQLVSIINEIKHIPIDQINVALLDIIPSPEASFEEIAAALHPCHVLTLINDLKLSHGSLDSANLNLEKISRHLEALESLDASSFEVEAVWRYLNDVLNTSQGRGEIFERACQLAKSYKIPLAENLIAPVMTYLLPFCEKDSQELEETLALTVGHEEYIPLKLLQQAFDKIFSLGSENFVEIDRSSPKMLEKLSEPIEITSIPFAVLRLLVALETGNSSLKEEATSYLQAHIEEFEFEGNLDFLEHLLPSERQNLAEYMFLFSEKEQMFKIAHELIVEQQGRLPSVESWQRQLGWIKQVAVDPAAQKTLKEITLSYVDSSYTQEEFFALARNVLSLPDNLREKAFEISSIPVFGSREKRIDAQFNVVNILHALASEPKHKVLLEEFLEYFLSGKGKEQDAIKHLLQLSFLEEDKKEACLDVVAIILKTSDRLEVFQREQLDIDLEDDKKGEIVEKLIGESDVIIQKALKTIAPVDRLTEVMRNIDETNRLDELIKLPLGEDSITFKNTIRSNLSSYRGRSAKSLLKISSQLLTVPKEIRAYILGVLLDQFGDKAFEPYTILLSFSSNDPLLPIYLQTLSLGDQQLAIQELLTKAKSALDLSTRTTYETAIAVIMCNNQELRETVEALFKTPLFSETDLTCIERLNVSTQDVLLESMKKAGKDPDSFIREELISRAKDRCWSLQYRSLNGMTFDDEDHPIEFVVGVGEILLYQRSNETRRCINEETLLANIKNMNFQSLERIKTLLDEVPELSDQQILSIVSNIQEIEGQMGAAEAVASLLMQNPYIPKDSMEGVNLFIKAVKELLTTEESGDITEGEIRKCLEDKILPELYLDPQAIKELTLDAIEQDILPPKLAEARKIFQEVTQLPFYQNYSYITYSLVNLADKKNCYRVYASIKEAQKEEISLVEVGIVPFTIEARSDLGDLGIDYEDLKATQVSLNIEGFQEKMKTSSISVKDLPDTVTADTPLRLFGALKRKILQFEPDIQSKIKTKLIKVLQDGQVLCSDASPIEVLLDRLVIRFKDNDYSEKLMHTVPKDPEAFIDQDTYRLYVIFDYIQKLSNEPKGEYRLSAQDDYLILTFANIQQCSTGQSEGIAQIYALTQDNILALRAQESGEKFIDKFIQDTLVGALKTEGLDNRQQVHQDLYLKNILADWIGLRHSLTFDQYSHLIDDDLIDSGKMKLLQDFYKRFPNPVQLCKNLQKHINGMSAKAYPMIAPLLNEDSIYWDEEGKISIEGCISLLERFHYLKIMPNEM